MKQPTLDVPGVARELIALWLAKPLRFVTDVYGFDPDPYWQVDFFDYLTQYDKIAIRSGVGTGKSTAFGLAMRWWITTRYPAMVFLTSNKREQIQDIFWNNFELWEDRKRPEFDWLAFKKTEDKIALATAEATNLILPRTAAASTPESAQGYHSRNMMMVVDEAFAQRYAYLATLYGAMTTEGSLFLMGGNPTKNTGFMADCFRPNTPWKTMTIDGRKCRHVSKKWCDDMLREHGADGAEYRVRVLGLPPLDDENQAIPTEYIQAAMFRDVPPEDGVREVWGLDVAGEGRRADRTALAFRQGNVQPRPVKHWRGLDPIGIEDKVTIEWLGAEVKPAAIVIDGVGMGWGIYHHLRDALHGRDGTRVVSVNVGASLGVLDKERFPDKGSELLWMTKQWVKRDDTRLIDDALADELAWYRATEMDRSGKWRRTGKMKESSRDSDDLTSPDLGDAWQLTFAVRDIPQERTSILFDRHARPQKYGKESWMTVF